MAQRFLSPGEIESQATDVPPLRLPDRATLFAERAERSRSLAVDSSLGDYLRFVAEIAQAQHELITAAPSAARIPPMDPNVAAQAKEHGMPPLAVASFERDPGWRRLLANVCVQLRPRVNPAAAEIIARIEAAPAAWIEGQADKILNGIAVDLDRGAAVFIAAALQVYWTRLAAELGIDAFGALDEKAVCPCCGSRPLAGVIRPGPQAGLRYLICSLCAAEWHLVRITCANCGSDRSIEYFNIDGESKARQAEACDECDTYLKLFNIEVDPLIEPVADDLASIALDLLMAEKTHFLRSGVSLALFHGEAE